HVQPLQLSAARKQLRTAGSIIEHKTRHKVPVSTVRLPFPAGRVRELQRLAGSRSKKFQKFLSWTGDYGLCGQNGERVVFASVQAVAGESGLYVPAQQPVGAIDEVDGFRVARGTFDVLAHILET